MVKWTFTAKGERDPMTQAPSVLIEMCSDAGHTRMFRLDLNEALGLEERLHLARRHAEAEAAIETAPPGGQG